MTLFAAAAWSLGARLGLDLLILAVVTVQPRARLDAVTLVLCQAAAFLGALFLLLHVHDRHRPLRDSVAFRPTLVSLCVVGAALGVTLHAPFDRLADLIAQRFPPSAEQARAQAEAFFATDLLRRSAVVLSAGLVAPLVEELFFRGGIYGGLCREHTTPKAAAATALFFACSHLSTRNLVPVFAIGLILSHARASSGSLWPGLALHVAFNTTSIVDNVRSSPDAHARASPASPAILLAGIAASLALMGAYHLIAQRSSACATSRQRDLSGPSSPS
jgi:membrane protease YdiL (CAAX protease family)